MALDVYREIPSVLISTALGLRPRAVLISTSGIFPVYRLKPCVNLYVYTVPSLMQESPSVEGEKSSRHSHSPDDTTHSMFSEGHTLCLHSIPVPS